MGGCFSLVPVMHQVSVAETGPKLFQVDILKIMPEYMYLVIRYNANF